MKIHTIEITDYKAFLGTYKFNVGGKNLFICGENGSGKRSRPSLLTQFTLSEDWVRAMGERALVLEAPHQE